MTQRPAILFTAFEPSADALAAGLIAELRRRRPELVIHALGGPQMRDAGARLIENTTQHAVMGAAAARQAVAHRRRITRLRAWMRAHELSAVVPTDSPAANWAVCRATRELRPSANIVHLAAPQLWAWASWRIGRLRRLTDHVMCLLPFEPQWFVSRGVPATFVGHPIFDEMWTVETASDAPPFMVGAPPGGPPRRAPWGAAWAGGAVPLKLALLPGSRRGEVKVNLPTMIQTVEALRGRGTPIAVVIACADAQRERQAHALAASHAADVMREGRPMIHAVVGRTQQVLAWSDVVLTVSGTATLQVAAQRKPMVILYNVNPLAWHGAGRWLVSTRTFTLPNLLAEHLDMGRVVPELVPHFGGVAPVVQALEPLLSEGRVRQRQCELFEAIHAQYAGRGFAAAAADVVESVIRSPVTA